MANFWTAFDHDGRPADAQTMREPATAVLDELAWWAPMLREARTTRPYPGLDFELVTNSVATSTEALSPSY